MLKLIPEVKKLELLGAKLPVKAISFDPEGLDSRLVKALEKLPRSADGVTVQIKLTGKEGEGYQLRVQPEGITVEAQGICLVAELTAKFAGLPVRRLTDTEEWIKVYSENWCVGNKESELCEMTGFIRACQQI